MMLAQIQSMPCVYPPNCTSHADYDNTLYEIAQQIDILSQNIIDQRQALRSLKENSRIQAKETQSLTRRITELNRSVEILSRPPSYYNHTPFIFDVLKDIADQLYIVAENVVIFFTQIKEILCQLTQSQVHLPLQIHELMVS